VGTVATGWSALAADALIRRQPVVGTRWAYEWATLLKGVDQVRWATGDRRYLEYIRSNVDRFLQGGGIATYAREVYSLDSVAGGPLLLSLYRETGEERYRAAAVILREQLRAQPRTPSGGFWHKRIYPDQMWLDGIYMAGPFYAEFAVLFGDTAALDDVARQITLIAERTRDERTGLLRHAWDESRRERWADPATGRSPCAWGRALGWFAMALADVLELLPERSVQRDRIAPVLADTMAAVKRVQDEASGLWWQVLDQGGREGNYLEASASSMFVYAAAKGARLGHLGRVHLDAARRGYEGILARFVTTTADGDVRLHGSCAGTGLGRPPNQPDASYSDGSYDYYVHRPLETNDHRGLGALLMASVELERASGA
jgi:unsaturated rhamnogalacturonyl hydrolase